MKNIFKNKNVLIVGLKKSGASSFELLTKLGAFCYCFDDDKTVLQNFATQSNCNIASKIDDEIIKIMDFLIISPSISIYSECVKLAKLYGVCVLGELELGCMLARGKIVGVTGTNGKSTTCSLIYHILKLAKKPAVLCGNIGEPITQNLLPFKSNYVVEMSSFQLESSQKIRPDISAITNLAPNHLDRHLNFKNYKLAKFNIFKNMKKSGHLILNFDDKNLAELKKTKFKPKVVWISAKSEIDGYFAKNGNIFEKKGKKTQKIANFCQTKLVGKHNIYNILIATAVAKILKISNSAIQSAINSFEPLKHRIQFVKNVDGVDYYDDSKSTSPQSTITALNAIKNKPIVLILGGSDKNTSFDALAKKIAQSKNIRHIVVSGDTSKKIVSSLRHAGIHNYYVSKNFFDGLEVATKLAENGDAVLLSPACASFDYFSSFEERGDAFCEYVRHL